MSAEGQVFQIDGLETIADSSERQVGLWSEAALEMADIAGEEAFLTTLHGNAVRSAKGFMFDVVGVDHTGYVTDGRKVEHLIPGKGLVKAHKYEKDTVSKAVELREGNFVRLAMRETKIFKSPSLRESLVWSSGALLRSTGFVELVESKDPDGKEYVDSWSLPHTPRVSIYDDTTIASLSGFGALLEQAADARSYDLARYDHSFYVNALHHVIDSHVHRIKDIFTGPGL